MGLKMKTDDVGESVCRLVRERETIAFVWAVKLGKYLMYREIWQRKRAELFLM